MNSQTKHGGCTGGKNSPEYQSHTAMMNRCYNPERNGYPNYGGRGIKVCDRWREPDGKGFLNFLEDMGTRPEGKSLDREDGTKGYRPENCRWSDRVTQNYNTHLRQKGTSSKFRGVIFRSGRKSPWVARIGGGERGKTIRIGSYRTEWEAAAAYNLKALEIHGLGAKLNAL